MLFAQPRVAALERLEPSLGLCGRLGLLRRGELLSLCLALQAGLFIEQRASLGGEGLCFLIQLIICRKCSVAVL